MEKGPINRGRKGNDNENSPRNPHIIPTRPGDALELLGPSDKKPGRIMVESGCEAEGHTTRLYIYNRDTVLYVQKDAVRLRGRQYEEERL